MNKLNIASAALAVAALVLTIIAFFGTDRMFQAAGVIGAVFLVTSILLDFLDDRQRSK